MIYYIDIDNTICSDAKGEYALAIPFLERIARINELYDAGHEINYYTSRGVVTKKNWRKLTKHQLKKWGAKYHKLLLNKPYFDWIIDDKAINSEDFFSIPPYVG